MLPCLPLRIAGTWGTVVLVDEELVVARKGHDLRPAVAWHLMTIHDDNSWGKLGCYYIKTLI